jgi:hypothetical protein
MSYASGTPITVLFGLRSSFFSPSDAIRRIFKLPSIKESDWSILQNKGLYSLRVRALKKMGKIPDALVIFCAERLGLDPTTRYDATYQRRLNFLGSLTYSDMVAFRNPSLVVDHKAISLKFERFLAQEASFLSEEAALAKLSLRKDGLAIFSKDIEGKFSSYLVGEVDPAGVSRIQ